MVGTVCGTYSSVCLASAIWSIMENKNDEKKAQQRKEEEAKAATQRKQKKAKGKKQVREDGAQV